MEGKKVIDAEFTPEEQIDIKDLHLLTAKPLLYIANVSENEAKDFDVEAFKKNLGLNPSQKVIPISAKIEEELGALSDEEAKMFLADLGLKETGLNGLIRAAYETLNLMTYFTAGEKEVRAWTIHKGDKGPQAAGVIHTDFEKGYICAETIGYEDFVQVGSEQAAKEKGFMRTEGKEYVVKDGDIMHFRFNN